MIRSMTGFGSAEQTQSGTTIKVELRSLNGKNLDINLRIPTLLKPYEFKIRKRIKTQLTRGSVDAHIQIIKEGAEHPMKINKGLATHYFEEINELAENFQLPKTEILQSLLNLPEVVTPLDAKINESEWAIVNQTLNMALEELNKHRLNEGSVLEKDLIEHISIIEQLQEEVKKQDPLRIQRIREKVRKDLADWIESSTIDQNRLEQELVYYVEKLDISEEQVRLANHCRYFKEVLKEDGITKGRKLNFILQETGREINTTGSKANDTVIQQLVVKMKDELDKAKEQVMNIL